MQIQNLSFTIHLQVQTNFPTCYCNCGHSSIKRTKHFCTKIESDATTCSLKLSPLVAMNNANSKKSTRLLEDGSHMHTLELFACANAAQMIFLNSPICEYPLVLCSSPNARCLKWDCCSLTIHF